MSVLSPADDPLNNMAWRAGFSSIAARRPDTIHPMPTDADNPDDAARRYESELKSFYGAGRWTRPAPCSIWC